MIWEKARKGMSWLEAGFRVARPAHFSGSSAHFSGSLPGLTARALATSPRETLEALRFA